MRPGSLGRTAGKRAVAARAIEDRGKPEVENLGDTLRGVADVARLDVPVEDARAVHAIEGVGQQRAEIDDFLESDRPAPQRVEQRAAFEILEDRADGVPFHSSAP